MTLPGEVSSKGTNQLNSVQQLLMRQSMLCPRKISLFAYPRDHRSLYKPCPSPTTNSSKLT